MCARLITAAVLIGSIALGAGCSQSPSPSGPTPVPSTRTSLAPASTLDARTVSPDVPFKGTFEGYDTITPPVTVTTSAGGNGTHLGRFTFTHVRIRTASGFTGSSRWVAANGDSLETTTTVSGVPGPLVVEVTERHTVTGGTGRFAGAQGTFTLQRTHIRTPSEDGTHVTYGSFEGTITSPGAAR